MVSESVTKELRIPCWGEVQAQAVVEMKWSPQHHPVHFLLRGDELPSVKMYLLGFQHHFSIRYL